MNSAARYLWPLAILAVSGCVNDPVDWGDISYRGSKLGDPDTRSAVLSANLPQLVDAPTPCLRSIRATSAQRELFRAWWSARPDSSVVLVAQRSENSGATWNPPVVVDARDRGARGCKRPPPDIAYDAVSGYLHLVYFIEAADGKGVFFAHSMDNGAMFHSPVPVVYGNLPSAASVAAHGDSVVVVFEDPNASTPRIGIVLSRTAGHIFEQRGQVTPDEVPAVQPWVALEHKRITVWWKTASPAGGASSDQVGYRAGTWR